VRHKIAEPSAAFRAVEDVVRHDQGLQRYDRERLIRLDLDSQNRLISEETVSIGTATGALVSPREVFRGAILNGAVKVILLHNHPGGNPSPSDEDQRIARVLREASEVVGVPLIDFLIIGENGRYSRVDVETGDIESMRLEVRQ
jgi:DNA repair protein RadC